MFRSINGQWPSIYATLIEFHDTVHTHNIKCIYFPVGKSTKIPMIKLVDFISCCACECADL